MKIKTLDETLDYLKSGVLSTISTEELVNIIPSFGLNNESLEEQPTTLSEYYGKGLRIWQYPIQLAPFMIWLKDIKVNSSLEIGSRWGGNFIVISQILKNNNPDIKLYACDIMPESSNLYQFRQRVDFEYLEMDSQTDEFKTLINKKSIEFAYIDGIHTYKECMSDYKLFENNSLTKYIVFHDIDSYQCIDIKIIWDEVKTDDRFDAIEFIDQYSPDLIPKQRNFLGIGVLIRKSL